MVFIKFNCFTDEEGRPGGEEGDEEEAECSSSATSGSGRNLLDLCRQPTVWTYWGFALGSENCQTRAFAGLDEDSGRSLPMMVMMVMMTMMMVMVKVAIDAVATCSCNGAPLSTRIGMETPPLFPGGSLHQI